MARNTRQAAAARHQRRAKLRTAGICPSQATYPGESERPARTVQFDDRRTSCLSRLPKLSFRRPCKVAMTRPAELPPRIAGSRRPMFSRPRDRRESPQVDRALHANRFAEGPARIARPFTRAGPALVDRRTTILQRAAAGFIAAETHRMPQQRRAGAVVAIHAARLVVNDVRPPVVAGQHPLRLFFPQRPRLNQRLDLCRGQQRFF